MSIASPGNLAISGIRSVGGTSMAGESAQFGLRERPPTPAVRPFDLPARLKPMLDRAKAGLAEPFHGVARGGGGGSGPLTVAKAGVSAYRLAARGAAFVPPVHTG